MKKLASLLLVLAVFLSLGTVALAADTTSTQSTKLTTTVPAATYVLNIPADQAVDFGATTVDIGNVTVTDSSGFAQGKNVEVTVGIEPFASETTSTTIPFTIHLFGDRTLGAEGIVRDKALSSNGNKLTFLGSAGGTVSTKAFVQKGREGGVSSTYDFYLNKLQVEISSANWGKALAGDYTATITFTSEVVADTDNT